MKNIVNIEDNEYIQASIIRGSKWEEVDYFLDDKEIIQQFIDTESFALVNDTQGLIYPDYHYEINRILKTAMNEHTENEKIYSFYYTLNLHLIPNFHKKNYNYFKKAFALILPRIFDEDFFLSITTQTAMFVLFNGIDKNIKNEHKLDNISFSEFQTIRQFIGKCTSYSHIDSMKSKSKQFEKYRKNNILMELIRKNLPIYFESKHFRSDYILSGILIMLFTSNEKQDKDLLEVLNKCKMGEIAANCLEEYYNDFLNVSTNKLLFENFKNR